MKTPKEITELFVKSSIKKVNNPIKTTLLMGVLAGFYIGLGAIFYTIVKADPSYSFATKQIVGGLVFCIGLVLVLVAGAELFTGNNLITIGVSDKKVSIKQMLKNWVLIYFSNAVGALILVGLVYGSGHLEMNDGAIAKTYVKMAEGKTALAFETAFFRGVLCNILVCLAVWMAAAGKSLTDKVIGLIFPITLFVAAGFEHSIANAFIIPLGLVIDTFQTTGIVTQNLNLIGLVKNLIPVTLGNIVGGGIFVGLIYYTAFDTKEIN